MLNNLRAEMTRHGISASDIANLLGITENTARNKISGRTKFSVDEALKVNYDLFPDNDLSYLFSTGSEPKAS